MMQRYEIPADKAEKLREFLRNQLATSPFGLSFSENGKLSLCRRFGLSLNQLDEAIAEVLKGGAK